MSTGLWAVRAWWVEHPSQDASRRTVKRPEPLAGASALQSPLDLTRGHRRLRDASTSMSALRRRSGCARVMYCGAENGRAPAARCKTERTRGRKTGTQGRSCALTLTGTSSCYRPTFRPYDDIVRRLSLRSLRNANSECYVILPVRIFRGYRSSSAVSNIFPITRNGGGRSFVFISTCCTCIIIDITS